MKEITVLLVDDHQLVRKGFRRILEDDPDIQVIGEAGSGVDAIQMAEKFGPRVVVMGIPPALASLVGEGVPLIRSFGNDGKSYWSWKRYCGGAGSASSSL